MEVFYKHILLWLENDEAQHGNYEKETVRYHGSGAWNMGAEVETFPQNHTKCVSYSPHSPPKCLKLPFASGNEQGVVLWFDFCLSVVGCQ